MLFLESLSVFLESHIDTLTSLQLNVCAYTRDIEMAFTPLSAVFA